MRRNSIKGLASVQFFYIKRPNNVNVECISSWVDLLMGRIVELSKYYVIFIYFQAAVSAMLAVLYFEKKIKINITQYFENSKIRHISKSTHDDRDTFNKNSTFMK